MKLFISMLVFAASLSATAAGNKLTIEEAKAGIANVCAANSDCLSDLDQLNDKTTCDELRDFLARHSIVAADENGQPIDVADVVQCVPN